MNDVLAFDLGGSSLRLAVVSTEGEIRAVVRKCMRIPKGRDGEFEVDPSDWWDAFVGACQDLRGKGVDLKQVGAIAGCGFTRTQVPLDKSGEAVHPAITFQDARGSRVLSEYLGKAAPDLCERYDGLSPFHPIARLLWLSTRKPEVWSQVHKVIEPKDYINFRLTGEIVSDGISQNAARSFFDAILGDAQSSGALGFDDSKLPGACSPFEEIGLVRDDLQELADLAGKPVYCGSTDTWTCVLGTGAMEPTSAYCISGTSDVSGVLMDQPHAREGLLTVKWGPGLWQLGGPSQGAATRLDWAAERFGTGSDVVSMLKSSLASAGRTPIFLPYLEGERTPYWDNDMRGAFLGLDGSQTNADFMRAVAEGINFLSRVILTRAEAATGEAARHICFAGGLSNNPLLCQLKADITDRPVFVAQHDESGLVGAACLPGNAPDHLSEISRKLMAKGTWYAPNAARRGEIDARFDAFTQATEALRPLSKSLLASANAREGTP